jgi:type II secretory pathway component PulJ
MGSSTLIDIVGSMVIGSLLLLVALRMNDDVTKNTFESQENLTIQQNMISLVNNLESDFRKIGYCADPANVPMNDSMIVFGDSTHIKFLASMYPETASYGLLDTVEWYLGTSRLFSNIGQGDTSVRMLYRKITDSHGTVTKYSSNLGVTQFHLLYFKRGDDQPGDTLYTISPPTEAKLIEIDLRLEPTTAYDTAYSSNYSVWRQIRLTSINLTNR